MTTGGETTGGSGARSHRSGCRTGGAGDFTGGGGTGTTSAGDTGAVLDIAACTSARSVTARGTCRFCSSCSNWAQWERSSNLRP